MRDHQTSVHGWSTNYTSFLSFYNDALSVYLLIVTVAATAQAHHCFVERRLGKAAGKRGESDGDSARSLFLPEDVRVCVGIFQRGRESLGKPPLTFSGASLTKHG